MNVLAIPAAIGLAAVVAVAFLHARAGRKPGNPLLVVVFLAVFASGLVARRFVPVVWPVVPGGVAAAIINLLTRRAAKSWPRRAVESLLSERVAGAKKMAGWNREGIRIAWAAEGSGKGDIRGVSITLPESLLPTEVVDILRGVLGETLGGPRWSAKIDGCDITYKREAAVRVNPFVQKVLDIARGQGGFGANARVEVVKWADDAQTEASEFVIRHSIGAVVTREAARDDRTKQIKTRIPPPHVGDGLLGEWSVDYDLTENLVTVRATAFRETIYPPPIKWFAPSQAAARAHYRAGRLLFLLGLDSNGELVTWRPTKEAPHLSICGGSGFGKTSAAHTLIPQATAQGAAVYVLDFKMSSSFLGFIGWPGVQHVANDLHGCLRLLYHLQTLLEQRQRGGKIEDYTQIIVLIDEIAEFYRALNSTLGIDLDDAALVAGRLFKVAREFRMHFVTFVQKPTASNIDSDIIFNSGKKVQIGPMPGAVSQVYWNDQSGTAIPSVKGRSLTVEGDKQRVFQAYFTPDPKHHMTGGPTVEDETADLTQEAREELERLSAQELAVLGGLYPSNGQSLYDPIVFDMKQPKEVKSLEDIVLCPVTSASKRPDLYPLSPQYRPRATVTFDNLGDIDPASLNPRERKLGNEISRRKKTAIE